MERTLEQVLEELERWLDELVEVRGKLQALARLFEKTLIPNVREVLLLREHEIGERILKLDEELAALKSACVPA